MEIIKEIKTAEKEAKQIIEKAQAKSSSVLEDARKQRAEKLENGRMERRKIIDAAVEKASLQAKQEVAVIEAEAKQMREEIAGKSGQTVDNESEKVLGFIKSLSEK